MSRRVKLYTPLIYDRFGRPLPAVFRRSTESPPHLFAVFKGENTLFFPPGMVPQQQKRMGRYVVVIQIHVLRLFFTERFPAGFIFPIEQFINIADAAGCSAVVLVDDCVDMFNPKVVRSTAGSLFHLPILTMGTDDFFAWCDTHELAVYAADVYGTDSRQPESLTDVIAMPETLAGAKAVLFGNEARGLTKEVLERTDRIVSIPLYGKAESLNLGTSSSVMLLSLAMSSHVERM